MGFLPLTAGKGFGGYGLGMKKKYTGIAQAIRYPPQTRVGGLLRFGQSVCTASVQFGMSHSVGS